MFKPGDKVVCISTGPSIYLAVGEEYTVKRLVEVENVDYLTVEEIAFPHKYFPSRFILANICLENK